MKKIVYILSALSILSACSPKQENKVEFETKIEALATFQDTSTALADFGNPVTASTTRIYTFKNIGDTSGPGTATLSGANATSFSIILQTGCATVNVGSSCTVRVNFNPSGKAVGSYTADLNIGGTVLKTLTATVAAATTGGSTTGGSTGGTTGGTTSGGSGTIEASISGVVISNPLDYGSFTGTQTSTKIITLKNTGTVSTGPHTAALSDGDFTFTLNSCSNKTLAPAGSCSVRVTFNATSKTAQEYLTDLTFGTATFPLKATVAGAGTTTGGSTTGGTTSGGAAIISFLDGTTPIASPYSIGSTTTTSITKIITIKNTGTVSTGPHTAALSDTDITFTLNSCSSKTLAPNGSCTVRVTFNPTGKTSGDHSSTLTFGTGSIDLTATKSGAGSITYTSIYSNYSGCTVTQACQGSGIESRTLTACEQYTDGVLTNPTASLSSCSTTALTRACQSPPGDVVVTTGLPTGYDSRSVTCSAGQTVAQGTVTDVTCSTTHFKTGTTCSPNVITYTAEYSDYGTCSVTQACEGVGTQSRTFTCREYTNGIAGSLVDNSNCTPTSLTQACDSPPGTTTVTTGLPTGYDSQTVSCSTGQSTVQGTITAVVCSSNYNQQGLTCVENIVQHTVTVTKSKNYGDVTSQPLGINCANTLSCQYDFDQGTVVTLYPTVNSGSGYIFGGWTGACTGMGSCSFTVDSAKSVQMIVSCDTGFHEDNGACVENAVTYTLDLAGPTNGTIMIDAPGTANDDTCGSSCASITKTLNANDIVTLTFIPDNYYAFSSWSLPVCSTNPCVVTMDGNKLVGTALATPIFPSNLSISFLEGSSTTGTIGTLQINGQDITQVTVSTDSCQNSLASTWEGYASTKQVPLQLGTNTVYVGFRNGNNINPTCLQASIEKTNPTIPPGSGLLDTFIPNDMLYDFCYSIAINLCKDDDCAVYAPSGTPTVINLSVDKGSLYSEETCTTTLTGTTIVQPEVTGATVYFKMLRSAANNKATTQITLNASATNYGTLSTRILVSDLFVTSHNEGVYQFTNNQNLESGQVVYPSEIKLSAGASFHAEIGAKYIPSTIVYSTENLDTTDQLVYDNATPTISRMLFLAGEGNSNVVKKINVSTAPSNVSMELFNFKVYPAGAYRNVDRVSLGRWANCFIMTSDKSVRCVGGQGNLELGGSVDSNNSESTNGQVSYLLMRPFITLGKQYKEISMNGLGGTCALRLTGEMDCWGNVQGNYGISGVGSNLNKIFLAPDFFDGTSDASTVKYCAISNAGTFSCSHNTITGLPAGVTDVKFSGTHNRGIALSGGALYAFGLGSLAEPVIGGINTPVGTAQIIADLNSGVTSFDFYGPLDGVAQSFTYTPTLCAVKNNGIFCKMGKDSSTNINSRTAIAPAPLNSGVVKVVKVHSGTTGREFIALKSSGEIYSFLIDLTSNTLPANLHITQINQINDLGINYVDLFGPQSSTQYGSSYGNVLGQTSDGKFRAIAHKSQPGQIAKVKYLNSGIFTGSSIGVVPLHSVLVNALYENHCGKGAYYDGTSCQCSFSGEVYDTVGGLCKPVCAGNGEAQSAPGSAICECNTTVMNTNGSPIYNYALNKCESQCPSGSEINIATNSCECVDPAYTMDNSMGTYQCSPDCASGGGYYDGTSCQCYSGSGFWNTNTNSCTTNCQDLGYGADYFYVTGGGDSCTASCTNIMDTTNCSNYGGSKCYMPFGPIGYCLPNCFNFTTEEGCSSNNGCSWNGSSCSMACDFFTFDSNECAYNASAVGLNCQVYDDYNSGFRCGTTCSSLSDEQSCLDTNYCTWDGSFCVDTSEQACTTQGGSWQAGPSPYCMCPMPTNWNPANKTCE